MSASFGENGKDRLDTADPTWHLLEIDPEEGSRSSFSGCYRCISGAKQIPGSYWINQRVFFSED
jgi:hypothetical protein